MAKDDKRKMLEKAKKAFSDRFGGNDPFSSAIIAATQRAPLYTPNSIHADIREEWISQLRQITAKYNTPQTVDTFIEDVRNLKEHMNQRFPGRFNNGKLGYENGFRIAHAQKSLSVCLKHLWSQRNYKVYPPVCPVDGIMLKHIHNNDAWTKVNWIDDRTSNNITERGYSTHLALMKAAAKNDGFDSVAEWELVVWWEHTTKGESTSQKGKRVKTKHYSKKGSSTYDQEVLLKVYNNGKTFQIINNRRTLSHDSNRVIVAYEGHNYEAQIKTYKQSATLRGAQTIQRLISQNNWQPGTIFKCKFSQQDGSLIYTILSMDKEL